MKNIEYKKTWWSVSCKERYDAYFRNMNEDASENYDLRCRYLYKIYQVGVSPMYTTVERKSVVSRLLLNASEQTDENNCALDLICAYKIVQYNAFDMDIPHFRVSKTLWLKNTTPKRELPEAVLEKMSEKQRKHVLQIVEHLGPNEEILNLYNVAIQRDGFASFNPMKTEVNDGLFEGMNGIEAFNRRNNNAIKSIVISLLYNRKLADNIKYFRLSFKDGNYELYDKKIKDIRDLSMLDDSGNSGIEYYWIVFDSSPELSDRNRKTDIANVTTKTYKIAMFYKDFDHSSGNLHVLPGAMQVWEKEENANEAKEHFWIRNGQVKQSFYEITPKGNSNHGEIFAEECWIPIEFTEYNGKKRNISTNQYIFWYSWSDVWKHVRFTIGKEDFESLDINKDCRAGTRGNSKRFNAILIDKESKQYKQYKNIGFVGRNGTCTYDILKFGDSEDNSKIISGYRITYVEGEGYFYDFNGTKNEIAKGKIRLLNGDIINRTESPNDFIIVEDNKGYWVLKYKKVV